MARRHQLDSGDARTAPAETTELEDRMISRTLTAAAAAAFLMAAVGGAQATMDPHRGVAVALHARVSFPQAATVTVSTSRIAALRGEAWGCQGAAGLARSRAGEPIGRLRVVGDGYRAWVAALWTRRLAACRSELARSLPTTGDWETAVRVVQRVYPGSSWWLLSCSSSEGGHGAWVPNRGGSGAGGWMQYMEGTFVGDYDSAVRDLAARGVRVPPSSASWYSALGQAVAAGWAYGHDRPAGKWTGGGC